MPAHARIRNSTNAKNSMVTSFVELTELDNFQRRRSGSQTVVGLFSTRLMAAFFSSSRRNKNSARVKGSVMADIGFLGFLGLVFGRMIGFHALQRIPDPRVADFL
jgi:hypothetical protein